MFVEHSMIRLTKSISVIHFWLQLYRSTDYIRKMAILNWVSRNKSSYILHLYLSLRSNKCYLFLDKPQINYIQTSYVRNIVSNIKILYSFPALAYANSAQTFSMIMRKISWQPADKAPIARLPFQKSKLELFLSPYSDRKLNVMTAVKL